MTKKLIQLLVLLFFSSSFFTQQAQINNYNGGVLTLSPSSGTYTPLVGGTPITSILTDDAIAQNIPIGFNFKLNCDFFNTVSVSSNGFLGLAGNFLTSSENNNNTTSFLQTNDVIIAPLWDDLHGNVGSASFLTSGTTPNRVFTVEWKDWKWSYLSSVATISFQVKLYEGSNKIEFIYSPITGTPNNSPSASIGYFNGSKPSGNNQLWLTDFSANPGSSTTRTVNIATMPANGQVYTLNNPNDCNDFCTGTMLLNSTGGTNASDGLMVSLSGAGNMHIKKNNQGQIHPGSLVVANGTTAPFTTDTAKQGMVFAVGSQFFKTGNYGSNVLTDLGNPTIDYNTCQSAINDSPNHYSSVMRLSKNISGLLYKLNVYYDYTAPNKFFTIKYEVVIPPGHPAGNNVVLSHAWDTFLQGGDTGPGFVTGTAPYLTMGVVKSPSYEAFKYISGVPWAGYYSAGYLGFDSNLGADATFNNTIDSNTTTDNGMGISMNFGSTPGTYTSTSNVIFECNAPSTAPTLSATNVAASCPTNTINLNSLVTSTIPSGTVSEWRKLSDNSVVTNPTAANAGTYYLVVKDTTNGCESPQSAAVTVTNSICCTGNDFNGIGTVNGVTVSRSVTGNTSTFNAFTNCGVAISSSNNIHLNPVGGPNGGAVTYTFSAPVNNIVVKFNATSFDGVNTPGEAITFTTNGGGTVSATATNNCSLTQSGNTFTATTTSGGAIVKISSTSPYTTLTVTDTGNSGNNGTIVALCDGSIVSASSCNAGSIAPVVN